MSRPAPRFTQSDVAKALRGALAAGFDVGSIEISQEGHIRIVRQPEEAGDGRSAYDLWKAKQGAR